MDLSNYSNEDLAKLELAIHLRRIAIHTNAPTFLPEDFRDELIEYLADIDVSQCFGDGQELDKVLEGCSIKGLFLYTDHELVEMCFQCMEEGNGAYQKALEHLEEYRMLSGTSE